MRAELDQYAQQLHKTQKCGSNLYTLINNYEHYKDAEEIAPFDRAFISSLTKADIEKQQLIAVQTLPLIHCLGVRLRFIIDIQEITGNQDDTV